MWENQAATSCCVLKERERETEKSNGTLISGTFIIIDISSFLSTPHSTFDFAFSVSLTKTY